MYTAPERRGIDSYINKIGQKRYTLRVPIEQWTATEGEYRAPGDTAVTGEARPIRAGDSWWAQTLWFKASVTIPPVFDGKPVYLQFHNDGESLLYVDGLPAEGLDLNHTLYRLGTGSGQTVALCVESTNRWQNHAHAVQNGVEYPAQVFRRADLVTVDEDIQRAYYILSCLYEMDTDFAREWLLHARRVVHPDAPPEEFGAACRRFEKEIGPELDRAQKEKGKQTVLAVGHSHLDLGYLWPVKETVRKVGRTFANMLYLLDNDPGFHFSQSQTVLFEWAKEYYPQLFARVKEFIREGRFECVGGMYVEADSNMTGGESTVRQFLYGQHFLREEFGITAKVGWLPDTFGLSGILPQILKKSGIDSFYSAKICGNIHYDFPYTLYQWEGIDGSRVTANLAPQGTYNGRMDLAEMVAGIRKGGFSKEGMHLYAVGHGDGGGGVTEDMVRRAGVYDAAPGLPHVRWARAEAYFEAIDPEGLPVWRGEQYMDQHQGTFTTQAALKSGNRRSEIGLLSAEILDALAQGDQAGTLRALWKTVLFNQFHDILPGSCQRSVVELAQSEYAGLLERVRAMQAESMAAIAPERDGEAVTVFNTLSHARGGYVEVEGEQMYAGNVPSMGYRVYRKGDMRQEMDRPLAAELPGEIVLENDALLARLDKATGWITSLVHRQTGRESLSAPSNRFVLYDEVYEFYGAWNIHHDTLTRPVPVTSPCVVSIVENSAARAVVRVTRPLAEHSSLEQDIILTPMGKRLDFDTRIDWHETDKLLKAVFDVDVYAQQAQFDVGYGNLARSTGDNMAYEASQIEVCAHTWADLSDAHFGVALLNDCKYGYRVKGSEIALTLLKAPKYPDDQADMDAHRFTYALYPHRGDFRRGMVDEEAHDLNEPLLALAGARPAKEEASLLSLAGEGVKVTAVKRAHDGSGDIILRAVEFHGARAAGALKLPGAWADVYECDMLEDRLAPADPGRLVFGPYEIKTLRVSRG